MIELYCYRKNNYLETLGGGGQQSLAVLDNGSQTLKGVQGSH